MVRPGAAPARLLRLTAGPNGRGATLQPVPPALRRPLLRWLPALAVVLAVALPLTGAAGPTDTSPRSTGMTTAWSAEAPDDGTGTLFTLPPAAALLLAALTVVGLALVIVVPAPRVTSIRQARLRAPPVHLGI